MVNIYVEFDTINGITDAVKNSIFSDDPFILADNPTLSAVTVDSFNNNSEVEIGGMFYNVNYTKSDGLGGLVYDSNLEDYYIQVLADGKDIEDATTNRGLIIDDDFTGLTEEQALDFIYPFLNKRERLTVETFNNWTNLRDALAPDGNDALLEIFVYDYTFLHLKASLTGSNVSYTGVYDFSQLSGSRWSGWRLEGGNIQFSTAIPVGGSQIIQEIINSNAVIVETTRSGTYGSKTIGRHSTMTNIISTYGSNTAIIYIDFSAGSIGLVAGSSNNTFITGVTII